MSTTAWTATATGESEHRDPHMERFTVDVEEDGRVWFLKVREHPGIFGHAESWRQIEPTARNLIAVMLELPPDSVEVAINMKGARRR